MVRHRSRRSDEIMLIPFLDILCSLIGVLVLIIVVLAVGEMQKINGRSPEEIERAQSQLALQKELKENQRINALLKEKLAKLDKVSKRAKEKDAEVLQLRMLLQNAADVKQQNEKLIKELDNLMLEISGLTSQETALKKQIEALEAEVKQRQPPECKDARVLVQPGGSGFAQGSKVFVIESGGGKLSFYWNEATKGIVSVDPAVIAADGPFNAFLKAVAAVPQSKLLFLLRDDGMWGYSLGAGWAQANYGYGVERIGKLPIPGRGDIDMHLFGTSLGTLEPPQPTP